MKSLSQHTSEQRSIQVSATGLSGLSVLASVYLGCLLIVGNTPNTDAIDCYDCSNLQNASDCHNLTTCQPGITSCVIHADGTGDNRTYTLGCNVNDMCKAAVTMTTAQTVVTTTMSTNAMNNSTTVANKTTLPPPTQLTTTAANVTTDNTTDDNSTTTTTMTSLHFTSLPPPTARFANPAPSDSCVKCCNDDMCNKHQCDEEPIIAPATHPTGQHPCVDQKGTSFCEAANKLFDGCKNISIAKTICKKTCELCDLVDGDWSEWGNWSRCGVTCGNGTRMRMRDCDNPEPKAGGDNCTGSDRESEMCIERDCPVDGDWTFWSEWSACSVTCGVGLQKRYRNCSDPYPDAEGLFCLGNSVDENICFQTHCHDGEWLDWSEWSECSSTCDAGLKVRSRNCSETSFFGQACVGDSHVTELCLETKCQENVDSITVGDWSAWQNWAACSQTCGVGLKTRTRDCNETVCLGDANTFALCEEAKCKKEVPAFLVAGVSTNGPINGTIVLSKVITNVGDAYNTTTGEFVCEIPGLYNFFVSLEKQPNVNQAYCQLMKNNETTIFVGSRSAFIHDYVFQQASNSAVLLLEKGDVVYLGGCSDASTFTVKTTFSGSIIH